MKTVFADTGYWIALLSPKDRLHSVAKEVSRNLGQFRIVTSEMVLAELLNWLSRSGDLRNAGVEIIKHLEKNPNVEIVPQTSLQFRSAVDRYASRPDKEWGATDCASFVLMEEKALSEALTGDHHFAQAGFTVLMKTPV